AEVFLFVSGTLPVERRADRGDRVSLVGRLKREDLPASSRDVALPWTRYRMSVKSALEVRRTGRTALSLFSIPNLFFHRTLPASRSRGEWFDRNVRGPLAALLLGRTGARPRDGCPLPSGWALPSPGGLRPSRRAGCGT